MLNQLKTLIDTIKSLVEFLIHAISSLVSVLTKIPEMILFLTRLLGFIPSIFLGFGVLALSIYGILFMLGRNTK